jgi:hypothetical protein
LHRAYAKYYAVARRARGFFEAEGIQLPFKGDGPEADAIYGDLTVAEIEAMTQKVNDIYLKIRWECNAQFYVEQKRHGKFNLKTQIMARKTKVETRAREHHSTARRPGNTTLNSGGSSGDDDGGGSDSSDDPDLPGPGARAYILSSFVIFHSTRNKLRHLNRRVSRRCWRMSRNACGTQLEGRREA